LSIYGAKGLVILFVAIFLRFSKKRPALSRATTIIVVGFKLFRVYPAKIENKTNNSNLFIKKRNNIQIFCIFAASNNIAYEGRSFDFVHIYNYHRGMYHALVGSSYYVCRSYHILLIC
jgi:hypothetical protein